MLFKIDFTRPHLYEDVVTLNQGNLSTNNTLRCRVVTGGNDDVTGANIVCTFVINGKQIFESGKVVDGPRGIVDVVFPSEALVVGENTLEFLVNRIDGSVAQSPVIKYRVWQGLTTDEGVRADSNYPLLVELINQANSAVNSANEALEGANSVISQGEELKASVDKLKTDCIASVNSFTEENSAKIDNAISQNVAKVDAAIVKNEASVVKADAAAEKAILAANNSDTKTAENIKNVNAAIAAGTKDLEVKAARVDMVGVEHGSLKERLDSDFSIGDRSLKDYVIDLDNMKESQDLAYETDKGYLVCKDTQNGVVKDLNIYGKTVVNVLPKLSKLGFGMGGVGGVITSQVNGVFTGISSNDNYYVYDGENIAKSLYPNSQYTTKGFIEIDCTVAGTINIFYISLVDGVNKTRVIKSYKLSIGKNYIPINEVFITDGLCNGTCGFYTNNVGTINSLKFMFMMLQGDVTNLTINSHIEGIASVGNGNEIEVLSSNYGFNSTIMFKEIDYNTGNEIESNRHIISDFNYIKYDKDVSMTCNGVTLSGTITKRYYDINKKYLGDVKTNNVFYVRFRKLFNEGEINKNNVYKFSSNIIDISPEYKQDKKTILFKDTDNNWKPVTYLNEWDVLDTTKNIVTLGSYKFTVKGTEDWKLASSGATITRFQLVVNEMQGNRNPLICDKLPLKTNYEDMTKEGCFTSVSGNTLYVDILSSKANTVELFKTYLINNNISFVAKATTIKQYEINPLFPNSYDNETMILFSSGAIAPHAEWKIASSLPNFLQNIEDRVSRLENDTYKTNLANFAVALNMLDMKARLRSLGAPIN